MATPTISKSVLPGQLGEILVDVRSGQRSVRGPAVLILHGFKGFKDWGMFPSFAERVARAGFTAVSFNVSGSGVDDCGDFTFPERFGHNSFSSELADVESVLGALDRGELGIPSPSSVGIVGHSRGGGMAVLLAARSDRINAVATWAAIAHVRRWSEGQRQEWRAHGQLETTNARTGQVLPMYLETLEDVEQRAATTLDIEAAAGRIRAPWLIVHGDADEAVPIAEADRLTVAAKNTRVESLLLPGAGHTFGAVHPFAGMTNALETTFDRTIQFLSRVLP